MGITGIAPVCVRLKCPAGALIILVEAYDDELSATLLRFEFVLAKGAISPFAKRYSYVYSAVLIVGVIIFINFTLSFIASATSSTPNLIRSMDLTRPT